MSLCSSTTCHGILAHRYIAGFNLIFSVWTGFKLCCFDIRLFKVFLFLFFPPLSWLW